jgi:hypothetical protein
MFFKSKQPVAPLNSRADTLSTSSAEAKPLSPRFDLYLGEARAFKARLKRGGINGDQGIANMNQPEAGAPYAVGSGEHPAWRKHAVHLAQKPVLERCRRNVMEHRESNGSRELSVVEGQRASVTVDHGDIRATHSLPERIGQSGIDFNGGDPLESRAEKISSQARARTDLKQILPQIRALKRPRQHFALQELVPEARPTYPPVQTIHTIFLAATAGCLSPAHLCFNL